MRKYINLRFGIGLTAIAFPFILWGGGDLIDSLPLQESMSAYYYTFMRDVFVGVLVAIGSFLWLDKGSDRIEYWALNLAGILAIVIALVPMSADNSAKAAQSDQSVVADHILARTKLAPHAHVIHDTASITFFMIIAVICLLGRSAKQIRDQKIRRFYSRLYKVTGICMLLVVLAATLQWKQILPDVPILSIFVLEATAVVVFSFYWFIKTFEMNCHDC